jgi:hypothetical protein
LGYAVEVVPARWKRGACAYYKPQLRGIVKGLLYNREKAPQKALIFSMVEITDFYMPFSMPLKAS